MAAGENLTLFPSHARINPGAINGVITSRARINPGAINGVITSRARINPGAINGVITSRARIKRGAINGAPAGGSLQGAHLCAPGWGGCLRRQEWPGRR